MVTNKKKMAVTILSVLFFSSYNTYSCILEWNLHVARIPAQRNRGSKRLHLVAWLQGSSSNDVVDDTVDFFPIVSSLPIQMLAIIAYGVWGATTIVALSFAIASQIVYLIDRNYTYLTDSPKKRQKREELENKIKNSRLNIYVVLFLAYSVPGIPFLLISSVAAVSRIKWWKYTLFTLIGPIPEIVVTLLIGNQVVNSTPLASAIMLGVIITLVILSLLSLVFLLIAVAVGI